MRNNWLRQTDPGIIMICINCLVDGDIDGCFYHKYQLAPVEFHSFRELCKEMEGLFDSIDFPQSTVRLAENFEKNTEDLQRRDLCVEKRTHPLATSEDVLSHRGKVASFGFRIVSRLHATWQGELCYMEEDKDLSFQSMLEMMQIIDNLLQM